MFYKSPSLSRTSSDLPLPSSFSLPNSAICDAMASRNRMPTALEPYLQLPPELSLILLTSTLGCSSNWLLCRYIGGLLTAKDGLEGKVSEDGTGVETAVVLVSFTRDAKYWQTELRRTMGVDLGKMGQNGRYSFVDCFTTLAGWRSEAVVGEIEKWVAAAIRAAREKQRKVVLVLDGPDVLTALANATAHELNGLLLKLRRQVHSALLACAADLPFVSAAIEEHERPTPLGSESAAFIVQQVHAARMVLSVRGLATGAAKDVSGVLRLTPGGDVYGDEDRNKGSDVVKGLEALYFVEGNGNAQVFERSAGQM